MILQLWRNMKSSGVPMYNVVGMIRKIVGIYDTYNKLWALRYESLSS